MRTPSRPLPSTNPGRPLPAFFSPARPMRAVRVRRVPNCRRRARRSHPRDLPLPASIARPGALTSLNPIPERRFSIESVLAARRRRPAPRVGRWKGRGRVRNLPRRRVTTQPRRRYNRRRARESWEAAHRLTPSSVPRLSSECARRTTRSSSSAATPTPSSSRTPPRPATTRPGAACTCSASAASPGGSPT